MLRAHVQAPAAAHLAQLEAAPRAAGHAVVVRDERLDRLPHRGHGRADRGGEAHEALRLVDDQQDRLERRATSAGVERRLDVGSAASAR